MDVKEDRLVGAWGTAARPGSSGTVQGAVHNIQATAESLIEERPVATTLIVFGLGLGLGTAIGALLMDSVPHRSKSSTVDSLTQNVMDGLSRMVPDVIQRHFRG